MKNLKHIMTAVAVLSVAACSTTVPDPTVEMNKRLAELEKQQIEMEERQKAREQIQREEELAALPDWVLEPPAADATGFYGVGVAQSKHLNHARKSSRLQAEFELAKMYRQELSGSERAFEEGNTDGDVTSQTVFLIDKIVDAVPVVGYHVVEQTMVPIDGVFHSAVLLKLPYDQFNMVLKQQRAEEEDKKIQAHFDDLERRLAERRKQREEERDAKHQRELEALKARQEMLNSQAQGESQQEAGAGNTKPQAQ